MARTLLHAGFGLLTLLALSGCQDRDVDAGREAPGKGISIAVIPKGTIHEFWKSVNAGAQKAGQELDAEIIWKGPLREDDRDAQIAVVEDFISRGVSGIVLAPLDETALRGPVSTAMKAGIPVVIFDSGLAGEAGKDFISYVATDNLKAGQIAGEEMARQLDGQGNVVVLRYSEGSNSSNLREEGFLEAVAGHPGIKVLSSNQYAGVTTESAQQAGENLLARFKRPDGGPEFDGLFCATEPTAFGLLRALQDAGVAGDVKFIGFDSSEKMIAALESGEMTGFVVQNPREIGHMAVATMVAHLQGQPVATRIDTGAVLVTKENLHSPEIEALLHPAAAAP